MTTSRDITTSTSHPRLRPDTREAITTILVDTEAVAHRLGWDFQPVLFGLFDHVAVDGDATLEVDTDFVAADLWRIPNPGRPGEHLPVAMALHRLAAGLTSTAASRWLRHWLHDGGRTCVGVGLLFEGWAGPRRPGYRHGDLAKAPAQQRREVRVVAAVDTDLGLHRVVRVRGQDTPCVGRRSHVPLWSRQRSIVTGLCRLVRATHGL